MQAKSSVTAKASPSMKTRGPFLPSKPCLKTCPITQLTVCFVDLLKPRQIKLGIHKQYKAVRVVCN